MLTHSLSRALRALLVLLALASTTSTASAQLANSSFELGGTPLRNESITSWSRRFQPATAIDVNVTMVNPQPVPLRVTFPSGSEGIVAIIRDAAGNEVARAPIFAPVNMTFNASATNYFHGSWNQRIAATGALAPVGVYQALVHIDSDPGQLIGPTYFEVGDATAHAADIVSRLDLLNALNGRTYRPGQRVVADLVAENHAGHALAIRFAGPFLPQMVKLDVKDAASGRIVWSWAAPVPMIFTGPYDDVFLASSREYGPISWPGVDASGARVPAGRYTLVMKGKGRPALTQRSATVTIAGAPVRSGTVIAPRDAIMRVRPASYAPSLSTLKTATPVTVLDDTTYRYWAQVDGDDSWGRPKIGWVAKSDLRIR